jgi:tetratricopeptide (TPR) repeat protein
MRRPALATLLVALLAVIGAPSPSSAQRLGPAPKRPRLFAGADTNDAHAYLDFGIRAAKSAADDAASAFYWAARIDPTLADALYGRRVSILLGNETLLGLVMRDGNHRSRDIQKLDSLQLRAVMLNPFLYRRLDVDLLTTYYRQWIERASRRNGEDAPSRGEIELEVDRWLRDAGPYMRGWMAYGNGNFDYALSQYADALKQSKEKSDLLVERGRIFGMRGQADSAIAQFQQALAEQRKRDAKDVVVLYNSKAVLEQAIGMLQEQRDSIAAARDAYGRALQEDLAYWPAHMRLGTLAITMKDTATALSELALAAQIAPDEPYVHLLVGSSYAMLGKPDEAMTELKKAIQLEPFFASPHVMLGRLYDSAGFQDEAIAAYKDFLARASRADAQRAWVESRVAALSGTAK